MAKKKSKKGSKKKTSKKSEPKKTSKKSQTSEHDKILKNFFLGIFLIALIILIAYFTVQSLYSFEVEGVEFDVRNFCDSGPCITTYHTTIPVIHNGVKTKYNFYLRNDPRKLIKDVPFDGSLTLADDVAAKVTFNNYCKGFETIATKNLLNLYTVSGTNVVNGQNSTCESFNGGDFLLIQEGNDTYIEETAPGCYTINIKDCEILEGTERFMVEMFIEINEVV